MKDISNIPDDEIESLNDFQHARVRINMYLSSRDPHTQMVIDYDNISTSSVAITAREYTWVPAVFTAFREILDNAIDEVIGHGHGDQIDVRYDPATATFWISDNGRGIPIHKDEKTGKPKATLALTETKAGRNFRNRGSNRGMNGVGGSIVNMVSEYFQLDIYRDGKHFSQRFSEGEDDLVIPRPSIRASKKPTGTHIEFRLSKRVFHDLSLPERFVHARMYELALNYPDLKLTFQGKKVQAKGGATKTIFAKRKPISLKIEFDGFRSDFWLVPNFFEDGRERAHGTVNAIPLFDGGTHIDSFRRNFYTGVLKALEKESKRRKLSPNNSDLSDGMLIYSITEMNDPDFSSQAKTHLSNASARNWIAKAMDDPDFFKHVISRNKEWIESVYARCAERTMKKDNDDLRKAQKQNKRLKIEELQDATGTNRTKCTLFLCEGKSAVSGITEARDSTIHGALPLRGKVLNVYGKHLNKAAYVQHMKKAAANEALSKIASSLGLVVGLPANRLNLRYGHVYLATDADPDGANIAALLVNYFYEFWPELFNPRDPFISIFQTPFIIATKGKVKKYWFSDDHLDFKPEEYRGWEITRAKGLAALKKDDWKAVLEKPRVVAVTDDGDLAGAMELLFSPNAEDRKDWLGE